MVSSSNFAHYLTRFQQYFFKYKKLPTLDTCGDVIGTSSVSHIQNFYARLVEFGFLEKKGDNYEATEILGAIPFFEYVEAGFPSTIADPHKSNIKLEDHLVSNPLSTIFVKVKGQSMKDAGIIEGDGLIVDKGITAQDGHIVIAIVDGEYTVKYLARNEQGSYLIAANKDYDDIYPEKSLTIFGVVVGLFRKYH